MLTMSHSRRTSIPVCKWFFALLLLILKLSSSVCLAECFQETNGIVVMEAESAPSTSGWQTTTRFAGYTGSSAIEWTGNNYFGSPGNGLREYTIQITKTGTYRFQWRTRIGKGDSNTEHNDAWLKIVGATSFFAQRGSSILYPRGPGLDPPHPEGSSSGGWFKVYQNQRNVWSWQAKTSDNDAHDVFATFASPGVYTVQLSGRSNGFMIDRMVLSHSTVSESAAQNTNLGETRCSLGSQPGPPPPPPPTPAPTPQPSPPPTPAPTPQPTPNPTPLPTPSPTPAPTPQPTPNPTPLPTPSPTPAPTPQPTPNPTPLPTPPPTPAPVVPTTAPVAPTPQPVNPTPAPVAPTPSPVSPTAAAVLPTIAPVVPTTAPVAPTPQPVNPTAAPVATPSPVSPTPAPVLPTAAPVLPTVAPVAPTPAPVIPTATPVTPAPVNPTAAPMSQPTSSGDFEFRMNAGGGEYTDTAGNIWIADLLEDAEGVRTFTNETEILDTEDDPLFQTERFTTLSQISYTVAVPAAGIYEVVLLFAEIFNGAQEIGKRVFEIQIEGLVVESNLDIFSLVGGYRALEKTYFTSVMDGFLTITLIAGKENPKISAIQITSADSVPAPTQLPVEPTPIPVAPTPNPTPAPVAPPTQAPVPPTQAPVAPTPSPVSPTSSPPTSVPPTQAPPTIAPPTNAPPTIAPPTNAPPTNSPPTNAPPTNAPPTNAPPTNAPPTNMLPTQAPPTNSLPTNAAPTADAKPPSSAPGGCVEFEIDFSSLARGDYVDTQFQAYGLTLSASGGEGDKPRVFDTANPTENGCGDYDLGSPNYRCPYPGPGIGEAGEPGAPGENCVPLGNVLIIQEPGELCPNDHFDGGIMEFSFNPPVDYVKSIGLLDMDYTTIVKVSYMNEVTGMLEDANVVVDLLGDNSYQLLPLDIDEVRGPVHKVKLIMTRSGATSSITFCASQNL